MKLIPSVVLRVRAISVGSALTNAASFARTSPCAALCRVFSRPGSAASAR